MEESTEITQWTAPGSVLVVGGSLAGLATALALARTGRAVTVLERSAGPLTGGAGMGIDRRLLSAVTGYSALGAGPLPALPVTTSGRESTSWLALYTWLRQAVAQQPARIRVRYQATVVAVGQDAHGAWARTAQGPSYRASFLVGADGYRSAVRAAVCPEHLPARYAGYVLWRGLLAEQDLPGPLPPGTLGVHEYWAGRYRLIGYDVPGDNGTVAPGQRRLSYAWYDPARTALLEALGCVANGVVLHSVRPAQVPAAVHAELLALCQHWPEPWRTVLTTSLRQGGMFGTPIAEYLPPRLVQGRLALLGDAAHVVSPMTGSGYRYALLDAQALAHALAAAGPAEATALRAYEQARLPASQQLVHTSQQLSAEYLWKAR